MIKVTTNQEVKLKLSVLKAGSSSKEDFSNVLLKVFLCTPSDKIAKEFTIESGTDVMVNLGKLTEVGMYHVQAIWVKNANQRRGLEVGECIARAEVQNAFAVTNVQSEATDATIAKVVIGAQTHATTYGQDGLNVFELAVLRGVWLGGESEYLAGSQDAASKTYVDGIAATKADKSTTYTKTQTDGLLAKKADVVDITKYMTGGTRLPKGAVYVCGQYPVHMASNNTELYFCCNHNSQGSGRMYYKYMDTGTYYSYSASYTQQTVPESVKKLFNEDIREKLLTKCELSNLEQGDDLPVTDVYTYDGLPVHSRTTVDENGAICLIFCCEHQIEGEEDLGTYYIVAIGSDDGEKTGFVIDDIYLDTDDPDDIPFFVRQAFNEDLRAGMHDLYQKAGNIKYFDKILSGITVVTADPWGEAISEDNIFFNADTGKFVGMVLEGVPKKPVYYSVWPNSTEYNSSNGINTNNRFICKSTYSWFNSAYYYKKNEVYTKTEVDAKVEKIKFFQEALGSVSDSDIVSGSSYDGNVTDSMIYYVINKGVFMCKSAAGKYYYSWLGSNEYNDGITAINTVNRFINISKQFTKDTVLGPTLSS